VCSPLRQDFARGEYLDFHNFNRRYWKPVQDAFAIAPRRDLYDLHDLALRAGVPVFAVSRFMETSIAMIDVDRGHLAGDSFQHAVSLLDALVLEPAVDTGWTPTPSPATSHRHAVLPAVRWLFLQQTASRRARAETRSARGCASLLRRRGRGRR
jgi:hypothetical protein